jgi:hypothetical protein
MQRVEGCVTRGSQRLTHIPQALGVWHVFRDPVPSVWETSWRPLWADVRESLALQLQDDITGCRIAWIPSTRCDVRHRHVAVRSAPEVEAMAE